MPTAAQPPAATAVQPERASLDAHSHIQKYLKEAGRPSMSKEDLNAVLRLSQHLRVFGLVSAVGYVNQQNAQKGEVRERTVPVWKSLLEQLVSPNASVTKQALMEKVVNMARNDSVNYMVTWQQALVMANHWNFWARAYAEDN